MIKAIVTGHTRGLGAAIAESLLARNISVLGISRATNTHLAAQHASKFEQAELDLSDSAVLANWLAGDQLHRFLAGCETVLLVNNAGTVQPVGPVDTQDIAAVGRAIALNVAAPMMLATAVATASPSTCQKRILHVSSGAGRNAYPGWSIYCATKAALDHHARAVMLDQTPNLRICSLAPGVIDTDMQAEIRATKHEHFPMRDRFEALKRNGDLSSPSQTATRLVKFLLSDRFGESPVSDLRETGE